MKNHTTELVTLASGEIDVWIDTGGAICLKTRNEFNDPVELSEHEALELAKLLARFVEELREKS